MKENQLNLLTIYDLIKENPYSFFIPSYQRGYRWTKTQVLDLLEDIYEFSIKLDRTDKEFYCLQPVVVKPRNESWEVIDGQQRLTTIYLLLKYFNARVTEEFRKKLYSLHYQTREGSALYLESVSDEESNKNVDYFHIHQAYKTIKEWFAEKQNIVNNFEDKLLNSTKIIWYEVNEEIDSIDIFTRLNIGKIPLTSAELIKALFLFRDNFEGNEQTRQLRQLEIASEWDRIETSLRGNEFWGFISDGSDNYDNRIEFNFDLMSNKNNNPDKDFTFRYFQKRFDEFKDVEKSWKEVKDYFQTFQEWYDNRELFHLVGFLIAVGENIQQLKIDSVGKTKTAFKELLLTKIKKYTDFQVAELDYTENSDRKRIRNILLLFNIISIIKNLDSNYIFQFGRYKGEKWNIEHIHSIKSDMPLKVEQQKSWLQTVLEFTQDAQLKEKISKWLETQGEFETIYNEVLKKYSEKEKENEDVNDISNLTLLDEKTNKGYKNAVYPIKRKIIIQKDQNETFIPLCTKNVFLKYYNESVEQMLVWGKSDRESYKTAIIETLKEFLPEQTTNQSE